MSRRSLVLTAMLTAALAAWGQAAPIPPPKGRVVEVVFCIDTTRDMGDALAVLRPRLFTLWERRPAGGPRTRLRVGVVTYRDRGEEYVTRVFDLTDDAAAARRALGELSADGGGDAPEAVNQALHDAVHLVSWSAEPAARRVIVLIGSGPPHRDLEGDVAYEGTCAAARERGIVIHTVLVGGDEECADYWRDIARRGGGRAFAGPAVTTNVERALPSLPSFALRGLTRRGERGMAGP